MGTQTMVTITILATEVSIILKFDWKTVSMPFPPKIAKFWIIFFSGLFLWTFWQFFVKHKFSVEANNESDEKIE